MRIARTASSLGLLLLAAATANAQYSHRKISGLQVSDFFGHALAFAGDADGDGVTDLVAGAALADPAGINSGYAALISGTTGAPLHIWSGNAAFQGVGKSVAAVYDVDGDGHDDIAVFSDTPNSRVTVFSGATGLVLRIHDGAALGAAGLGEAATSMSCAGDVDADGAPDYVIGAPGALSPQGLDTGAALVFSGPSGALLQTVYGSVWGQGFGVSVAAAGDANGDGLDDVVVGAPFDDMFTYTGTVSIIAGGTWALGPVLVGSPDQHMGTDVEGLGDLNGDGFADFASSAGTEPVGSRVWIRSGVNGALLNEIVGIPFTEFGRVLARAGDHDGDGRDDLLIGAENSWVSGAYAGTAYLHSGATGALLRDFHGSASQHLGAHVAGGGDSNGDGAPDLLIGAPLPVNQAALPGEVHLFESGCQTLYAYGAGCAGTGGFVPKLDVSGCVPTSGPGLLTVTITNGYGGKNWLLFAGVKPGYFAQPSGCNLLIVPVLAPAWINTLAGSGPGAGTFSSSAALSATQIVSDVAIQAFCLDPKPPGFAASNAFLIGKPGT